MADIIHAQAVRGKLGFSPNKNALSIMSWRCFVVASIIDALIVTKKLGMDCLEGIMPSPFPGMDPYLEGYLWPDVHHRLATQISDQLMPHLRPRYVAHIEIQVVTDESPEAEIGIMYPDVEIVQSRAQQTPHIWYKRHGCRNCTGHLARDSFRSRTRV